MPGKCIKLDGAYIKFTCENELFKTDISDPINSQYPGSVTRYPIYENGRSYVLILEKVINKKDGTKAYWFMWYQYDGIPIIPMSGVIDKDDLLTVIKNISDIKFE